MKRIGMTLAAVLVGGVLLAPGEAKKEPADALHAAKCQCGSAADCTCKKGTCECPKCKKPKRGAA